MGKKKKPLSMRQRALRGMYRTAQELFYLASLFAGIVIPTPTLAAGVDQDVNAVCKTSSDAAFRAKYCQAAKDNKKGYVANKATAAVWGGVAVVCTAACAKTYTGGGAICKYSSLGGSAGEGLITKNFVSSLTGSAGDIAKAAAGESGASETTPPASTGKFDADACSTAGTTAKKSYDKLSDSNKNKQSLDDLKKQTKEMNTGTTGTNYMAGTSSTPGNSADGGPTTAAATADLCGESALNSAVGSIRCAASADPTLPAYVKSENFLKDVQAASGKSADAFFSGFETPAKSLFDSPAMAAFPEDGQKGAAVALRAMEDSSNRRSIASVDSSDGGYHPAGSGGNSGSGSFDDEAPGFDANAAIANLFGNKNGQRPENAPGVESVAAGGVNRLPASGRVSPEDRTISLFDRVQWRYGTISKRDQLGTGFPGGSK